jgi:large subunit ribosomal protein L21
MKYAILEIGGKQYVAREGQSIEVDRLPLKAGDKVEWEQVFLLANDGDVQVGAPTVASALVKGTVLEQIKARKVIVFKYKPKVRYRRKQGHRQQYTRVLIDSIGVAGKAKKRAKAESSEDEGQA